MEKSTMTTRKPPGPAKAFFLAVAIMATALLLFLASISAYILIQFL